ncbi:MAG: hypothetical protein A2W05_08070 [Candidatus Schekmanbacteria bacterium RBG_16_38_10]|uniref:Sulfotransferase domain-containing protein n=1 Tax=Candidatus Schekmanbacteria bacterium RBG_16_38_10 TaxID=1817879 RepID=A0A1F7RR94_9BACT|nr:MAG: hypothetical protein A2W05_08070 [Candidatus Schekmanbacteria bacterium RBG_16_38_10]
MKVSDYRYLIIGGATKSATTSLFNWLKYHPEVCTSSIKETRFFLDKEYPVPSKFRFEDGLEKYDAFFRHCDDLKIRLEATPDYLYSESTPFKIKDSLPDIRFIFILREPVSRLISWYRFSKQWNLIPKNTSIEEYIKLNMHDGYKPQHLRALEQGRYSLYLKKYLDLFGKERVFIAFFEEILKNSLSIMKEICRFAGINKNYYLNYDFKNVNPTRNLKHPEIFEFYRKMRFNIKKYTHDKLLTHSVLSFLRRSFYRIYFYLDTREAEKITLSPQTRKFLNEYYTKENHSLSDLISRRLPWKVEEDNHVPAD